jgi:hypothetical protein
VKSESSHEYSRIKGACVAWVLGRVARPRSAVEGRNGAGTWENTFDLSMPTRVPGTSVACAATRPPKRGLESEHLIPAI